MYEIPVGLPHTSVQEDSCGPLRYEVSADAVVTNAAAAAAGRIPVSVGGTLKPVGADQALLEALLLVLVDGYLVSNRGTVAATVVYVDAIRILPARSIRHGLLLRYDTEIVFEPRG